MGYIGSTFEYIENTLGHIGSNLGYFGYVGSALEYIAL